MGNEQQAFVARLTQLLVVECGYPRLAGAGGGNDQVLEVTAFAVLAKALEDGDLKVLRSWVLIRR